METEKKLLVLVIMLAAIVALVYGSYTFTRHTYDRFELRAFDIGQGDSILIKIPTSTIQVLIDGGPDEAVVDKVGNALPSGDDTIDIIILTHPHDDHLIGITKVIERYKVGLLIMTGDTCETPSCAVLTSQIKALSIPCLYAVRGQMLHLGEACSVEILHPFFSRSLEYKNANNASIVTAVRCNGKQALLVGDLEREGEQEMIGYLLAKQKTDILASNVIKIGHHGSKTATSPDLLDLVRPESAIISMGIGNKFGHPHKETLDQLTGRGVETMRTDESGEVIVRLD